MARGKSAGHISTTNTCDDCHTSSNWGNVVIDHNATTGSCSGCHNGIQATGKHSAHIATSGECDLCHATNGWSPASFDHNLANGSCNSCHNGTTATGKPNSHFSTTLQCDSCHDTSAWQPYSFRHSSPGYPGDHRRKLLCNKCHGGNSEAVTWPFPAYKPDCAGCHANDFEADEHKKTSTQFYTAGELRDCAGSCHLKGKLKSPEHRVNGRDF
ncbi:MAG TPA: hypothetical protein ENK35_12975 [Candidatus Tenderia sp.]|nr:hypothetical protein [Candidatus Tenderia sp.]